MNPTPNPYAPVIATPSPTNGSLKPIPATLSTTTQASMAQRSSQHNEINLAASGLKAVKGGSKSKRSSSKRSKRSKSKRSSSKRSKRFKSKRASSKRYKRGGAPMPTPSSTPKPSVVPVPQFAGAHNVGASANSVSLNQGHMNAVVQAGYDNPNAPPSNIKVV